MLSQSCQLFRKVFGIGDLRTIHGSKCTSPLITPLILIVNIIRQTELFKFCFKVFYYLKILNLRLYVFDLELRQAFIVIIVAGNTNITVFCIAPKAQEYQVVHISLLHILVVSVACDEL